MMAATPRSRTSYDNYKDVVYSPMFDDVPPMSPGHLTPNHQFRPVTSRHSAVGESRQSRPGTRPGTSALVGPVEQEPHVTDTSGNEDDKNPFTQPMDPINRQYYYKLWRKSPPRPQQPTFREGRVGAGWRHVKACNVSSGSYLCFIDGTVKAEENYFYPPDVMYEPLKLPKFVPPVKFKDTIVHVPVTYRGYTPGSPRLSQRALQGFQSWQRPRQSLDCYDVWWTKH
ncbi:hypothetical protein Btru_046585 [Bulinus truncatus]|nr:hypothetical protein Btru_046585 [Bulinus truncatus]